MKFISRILCLACGLSTLAAASAQPLTPLAPDTAVLTGRLPNGLTYIIRHNELPKHTAEFYIAQKVGAILEEDDQDGLAHFLEHMAFNGTKNFPGKGIINFLERVGVRFGENINAFTSLDETVYNLSAVPTTDKAIVDSALLVLHDWSGFITLAGNEIDKERGVIREEWRTRASASRRMYFAHNANTMPGTRYAVRDVIGDTAVVNNFPYKAIRDYYHKWYRPDLQGIVVVGDVDPKYIEAKIKELWQDIPAQPDAAERTYFKVPISAEPVFSILRDNEATRTSVQIQYRYEPAPDSIRNSVQYATHDIMARLCATVFNNRMHDLVMQGAPFGYAAMFDTDITPTLNSVIFFFSAQNGKTAEATQIMIDEIEKLRRWGVNPGELQRAADDLIKSYDDAYENRGKVLSSDYVSDYYDAFLKNNTITSIDFDRELVRAFTPMMTPEIIKAYIDNVLTPAPVMLVSAMQEDQGVYDAESYKSMMDGARTKELTPYKDEKVDTRLVENEPKARKVKKWADDKVYGCRVATLANGVEVYLKPTTLADNEILLDGVSRGGYSLLNADKAASAALSDGICDQMGLGRFSNSELRKALTGKTASASAEISLYFDEVSGSSSKVDFETMLQLVYLQFTTPRVDSAAYQSYYNRLESILANADKQPDNVFRARLYKALADGNPYKVTLVSADDLKGVTMEGALEAHKARFSSAKGFKFAIVGSFDIDSVMPAVCKWLGNLPTSKRTAEWTARGDYKPQSDVSEEFSVPMTTRKVSNAVVYSHKHPYSQRESLCFTTLGRILSMRYLESVREDQGGTYGVSVNGRLSKAPTEEYQLLISFDTDPDAFDKLFPILESEIKKIADEGPRADDLDKVKKHLVKSHAEALQENSQWVDMITTYILRGTDDNDYEQRVNSIEASDIQRIAKLILAEANKAVITMKPE